MDLMGGKCKHNKICILHQQNMLTPLRRPCIICNWSAITYNCIYQPIQTMSRIWIKSRQISLQANIRHYFMLPLTRYISIWKNDLENPHVHELGHREKETLEHHTKRFSSLPLVHAIPNPHSFLNVWNNEELKTITTWIQFQVWLHLSPAY